MLRVWGIPALLLPAAAFAQAPAALGTRATATIVQPSSARAVENLEVDLIFDELEEGTEMEAEVEVEPGAGGALSAPEASGKKAKDSTKKAKDSTKGKASATPRRSQAASYVVGGVRKGSFAVALPRGEDCVLAAPGVQGAGEAPEAPGARVAIKQLKLSVENQSPESKPGGLFLDERGTRTFRVGATLKLAAHQPRTTYRGQFNVTVAWN